MNINFTNLRISRGEQRVPQPLPTHLQNVVEGRWRFVQSDITNNRTIELATSGQRRTCHGNMTIRAILFNIIYIYTYISNMCIIYIYICTWYIYIYIIIYILYININMMYEYMDVYIYIFICIHIHEYLGSCAEEGRISNNW